MLRPRHAASTALLEMSKSPSSAEFRMSLHGLPYNQTSASKPPIRVISSTSLRRVSEVDASRAPSLATTEPKQDGDWLQAGSSARGSQTSLNTTGRSPSSLTSAVSIPRIRVNEEARDEDKDKRWLPPPLRPSRSAPTSASPQKADEPFRGITLDIPTGTLGEELSTSSIEFSKRGSMFIDGKRANASAKVALSSLEAMPEENRQKREPPVTGARAPTRILSTDEEALSEKVRSFYAAGTNAPHDGGEVESTLATRMGLRWQDAVGKEDTSTPSLSRATSTTDMHQKSAPHSTTSRRGSSIPREEHELAGGVEDWQDVDSSDVDRYGFIIAKSAAAVVGDDGSGGGSLARPHTSRDTYGLQRVSTSLQLASETPRRKLTIRRSPSSVHGSTRSGATRSQSPTEPFVRPTSSQSAYLRRKSTLRSASNKLPQNRSRRLLDEAGDMLTRPLSAAASADDGHVDDARARRKEIEREEKWRKMARAVPGGGHGGGMTFEFDTDSPKLIERTWKGIPDKWRATAWHAFLAASARKRTDSLSDGELIAAFEEYQGQSSPDDVQIDIDVPRTISSHIMFRRRYRGGQRLLFRVLHAMSLHFPETGYVQGMAALAATLLAYYEEEKAFVMLVRLWDLRGLDKLYKSGFGGLMAALDDFERGWLGQGELAKKLVGLAPPLPSLPSPPTFASLHRPSSPLTNPSSLSSFPARW